MGERQSYITFSGSVTGNNKDLNRKERKDVRKGRQALSFAKLCDGSASFAVCLCFKGSALRV